MAFSILDRVLNVLKVRRRLMRVLASAALSLAVKFTEDKPKEDLGRYLCDVSFILGSHWKTVFSKNGLQKPNFLEFSAD